MKRGIYFTLDGIFAAFIIVGAAVLLLTYTQAPPPTQHLSTTASDAITILNTLTVKEVDSPYTAQVLATNLVSENDTVLRAIAVLWATNNPLAENFTNATLANFSTKYSYAVYAEDTKLASAERAPQSDARTIATAKQQVSGIASGKPLSGSSAAAFLQKVQNKTTSSFAYFGGFIGQGNVTVTLAELPSDISASNIRSVHLELDTPAPFTLLINQQDCGYYEPLNPQNTTIEAWSIDACKNAFVPGNNTIRFEFNAALDQSYISGGLLEVQYVTNTQTSDPYASPKTVPLPSIEGIVNVYDSFYVPGNVTSMEVHLHYLANHTGALANNTFFITIGNTTVYRDNNSNTTQQITLTDVNLTALNYSKLSSVTTPVRLGFENLSFSAILVGNANVMLVTDVSGSMAWNFTHDSSPSVARECTNPLINASSTQRLSVAKCLDKQFATDILNITGNLLGLVSYDDTTVAAQTIPLTTNITLINSTIGNTTSGYQPGGGTCICCGINSAVTQLSAVTQKTTYINTGSTWRYVFLNNTVQPPDNDPQGNRWQDAAYENETQWNTGPSVLGSAENGTGPAIITDMGNTLTAVQHPVDLWDMQQDNATPTVDFTSGMNSTANTFGIAGSDDGWDWQGGTYGYANTVAFPGAVNGQLRIYLNTTPNNRNNCANNDCSGAYGIEFTITPELYAVLQQDGEARLSFTYRWDSNPTNPFNNADEVWVKARWSNATTTTYLGKETSSQGADTTPEIDGRTNPDVDFTGTYTADVTALINGPGNYYLDVGGKLLGSSNTHYGTFSFDNILLDISNSTDVYYLRTTFNVANASEAQTMLLNLLADDRATVYLNGVLVLDEPYNHNAEYWNVRGYLIPGTYVRVGTNVLAVRMENYKGTAKFDLRLQGLNTTKTAAMLVMTDGVANQRCAAQSTGDAAEDAILAACQAKERWGINVHTVGFSNTADTTTLEAAAVCGGGLSTTSANVSELTDFYTNVVLNILDSSVRSQSVVVSSSYQPSVLYNDSYLRFYYAPYAPSLQLNEIGVTTRTSALQTCSPTVFIHPSARILSSQVTSYSGEHWTDLVQANAVAVYNLSSYASSYLSLGDPFVVDIPVRYLTAGANSLVIRTGDSPTNSTACSENNSVVTALAIPLSTARTPVLENAIGCSWTIENDDRTVQQLRVPRMYAGTNSCSYTNASIQYSATDAYDAATINLLRLLDYDGDGRIFVSLSEQDIEIIVSKVSNVPYLWGPSLIEVRVWQ